VKIRPSGAAVCLLLAVTRPAFAQHHHGAPSTKASPEAPFRAGVTAVAARFDTMFYAGDYQGLGVALEWRHGRFGVHAGVPMYRLQENGATHIGLGDVMLGGDVGLLARGLWRTGAALGATLPTGEAQLNLGMGHPMVMPSLWVGAGGARAQVTLSVGCGRALARLAGHEHAPLVEPMNGSEVTAELQGEVAPWRPSLRATARLAGAVPAGVDGVTRAFGAVGATWRGVRIDTKAELQVGLAGDPFTVRGLVETAVRF
jgi:hypothetical protein